jgi:hypothetical protein
VYQVDDDELDFNNYNQDVNIEPLDDGNIDKLLVNAEYEDDQESDDESRDEITDDRCYRVDTITWVLLCRCYCVGNVV